MKTKFKSLSVAAALLLGVSSSWAASITHNGLTYETITSTETGKVWLDRNLGATQVCTSATDTACYGDYYQWGRSTNGHEKSNGDTANQAITIQEDTETGIEFIKGNADWLSINQDDDGAIRSANWDICPAGFKVPTIDEINAENITLGVHAFDRLKLPYAGIRRNDNAQMMNLGIAGILWSSTSRPNSESRYYYIHESTAYFSSLVRAAGASVRCIEEVLNVATTFSNLTSVETDDKAEAVTPFAGLTLTDADSTAFTATIALDDNAKGTLSATTIDSGDLATVQTAIQAITFTPTQNRVAVDETETTTITLTVTADGVNATTTNTVVTTSMNDAPTDISLSSSTLNQDDAADTVVGTLSTTDADLEDTSTYILVSGDGDTYNSSFNINGSDLRATNANMSPGSYSVRVKVTDGSNATFEKALSISVADSIAPVIDTPSTLSMLNGSTTVVTLAGTDSEGISWSISGSVNDNDLFDIDPSTGALTLKDPANIGTKSSYTVSVTASDGTNFASKAITITVLDPVILNYQGFLATNAGAAVNQTLSMTFKLYDALTGGNEVWSSTKSVEVTNGIYNVALGESVLLNDLDILDNTYYLGVSIESNNEMTPRQSIAPSGYIKILSDTKADKL